MVHENKFVEITQSKGHYAVQVIQGHRFFTNRKLMYDFLLVINEHFYSPSRQKYTKINDKQYTKYKKKKRKNNNQSLSNLTCSTDTGIMLKNLTLQDANAVSNSI